MLFRSSGLAGENCPSTVPAESKGHWRQVADILLGSPVPPSLLPATLTQRRAALAVSFFVLAVFFTTLPFARIGWVSFPGFIQIQKTLMLVSDLITAALLFGQYAIGRTRALNMLAGGYLFTALIAVPHALTFPQVFSETGLLAAGPQSAAWLYLAAHAVLSRPAQADEIQALSSYMQRRSDRDAAACQQIVWALLTSAEFRFNH